MKKPVKDENGCFIRKVKHEGKMIEILCVDLKDMTQLQKTYHRLCSACWAGINHIMEFHKLSVLRNAKDKRVYKTKELLNSIPNINADGIFYERKF